MNTTAKRLANHYPRSLPYSAPANLQAEIVRLRRWNIFLLVVTGAILVTGVAAVVYLQNRPGSMLVEERAKETLVSEAASVKVTPPAVPATDTALPAKKSANNKDREKLLEAVGSLSAVQLYQTYLNIGLVADAVEKETYSKTEATKILQTVGDLLATADKQLSGLPPATLDKDDREALDRIRAVAGQLRSQAGALLSFWTTADVQAVARYHQARERSWEDLKELLGIDE